MHASRLVLVMGLLTGCVHNWDSYEPDAAVADVVTADVPVAMDVPVVRDVPIPIDVPMMMRDVPPPPRDVVDVPIVMDVVNTDTPGADVIDATDAPILDVPVPTDVPCGMTGDPCCFGRLCSPGLVCGTDTICATMCSVGATACSSVCVDTNTDPNNCGSCGNQCFGSRHNCAGGMCVR